RPPCGAPSITIGATSPSARSAATNVVVFQCPCGTAPTTRCPTGARPYRRVIFVLAPVSSMNTNRSGSSPGIRSAQTCRFSLTSGRSCSAARMTFFERQLEASEVVEQRPDADLDPQPLAQLGEGRVRALPAQLA